jgi:hypothetical protein
MADAGIEIAKCHTPVTGIRWLLSEPEPLESRPRPRSSLQDQLWCGLGSGHPVLMEPGNASMPLLRHAATDRSSMNPPALRCWPPNGLNGRVAAGRCRAEDSYRRFDLDIARCATCSTCRAPPSVRFGDAEPMPRQAVSRMARR